MARKQFLSVSAVSKRHKWLCSTSETSAVVCFGAIVAFERNTVVSLASLIRAKTSHTQCYTNKTALETKSYHGEKLFCEIWTWWRHRPFFKGKSLRFHLRFSLAQGGKFPCWHITPPIFFSFFILLLWLHRKSQLNRQPWFYVKDYR